MRAVTSLAATLLCIASPDNPALQQKAGGPPDRLGGPPCCQPSVRPDSDVQRFALVGVAYLEYVRAFQHIARTLLEGFALSLGIDEGFFRDFHRQPIASLRLLHYPPRPEATPGEQLGIGAHTDEALLKKAEMLANATGFTPDLGDTIPGGFGSAEWAAIISYLSGGDLDAALTNVANVQAEALGGQPVPPLLYHTTPPPDALIISPRDAIRQDHNISLSPDMPTDQVVALEEQVDEALNVSSLVVGIGGIGLYPTMVMQTTDINWLMEVVAHEWVHNYLTVHPLGMMYLANPEMRIINETTAEIAGKEIGQAVMARFYPEYAPAPAEPASETTQETTPEPAKPVFSFRAAMYETRLNVETMLAEGKIEEAEAYMEERRLYMWENGYQIRKLNQAYFAFHGAYADQPGGAAGEDPVSAAVRALRAQSPTLASFIDRLAWMWSYDQLKDVVTGGR